MVNEYFDKVLTLCSLCKKEITVKSKYENRNKQYLCKECEENIHRCEQCGALRPYCNDCV